MTPKSELEQHSLKDLLDGQRELQGDVKQLAEIVFQMTKWAADKDKELQKPAPPILGDDHLSFLLNQYIERCRELLAENGALKSQTQILENMLRDRSEDVDRLVKENVALKIKLEETSGR